MNKIINCEICGKKMDEEWINLSYTICKKCLDRFKKELEGGKS